MLSPAIGGCSIETNDRAQAKCQRHRLLAVMNFGHRYRTGSFRGVVRRITSTQWHAARRRVGFDAAMIKAMEQWSCRRTSNQVLSDRFRLRCWDGIA